MFEAHFQVVIILKRGLFSLDPVVIGSSRLSKKKRWTFDIQIVEMPSGGFRNLQFKTPTVANTIKASVITPAFTRSLLPSRRGLGVPVQPEVQPFRVLAPTETQSQLNSLWR